MTTTMTTTTTVGDNDKDKDNDNRSATSTTRANSVHWRHDCFDPLTMDDYLDGCDNHSFPTENHGDASFTGVWQSSPSFLVWLEHNWDERIVDKNKVVVIEEEEEEEEEEEHAAEEEERTTTTTITTTNNDPSLVPFSILELGSGTGFLGIHLAYNLKQKQQQQQSCSSRANTTTTTTTTSTRQTKHRYTVTLSDNPTSGAYFWTRANLEKALKQQQQLEHEQYETITNQENNNNPDEDWCRDGTVTATTTGISSANANTNANANKNANVNVNVNVIPFDWSCREQRREVSTEMDDWDLILGTDLIYTEEGCVHLVRAMASLLLLHQHDEQPQEEAQRRTQIEEGGNDQEPAATTTTTTTRRNKNRRILYGHTSGRMEGLDQKFENELTDQGLRWTILERIPLPSWSERSTTIYDIRK